MQRQHFVPSTRISHSRTLFYRASSQKQHEGSFPCIPPKLNDSNVERLNASIRNRMVIKEEG